MAPRPYSPPVDYQQKSRDQACDAFRKAEEVVRSDASEEEKMEGLKDLVAWRRYWQYKFLKQTFGAIWDRALKQEQQEQ